MAGESGEKKGEGAKRAVAVALAYQPVDAEDAPKVVATGRGTVAQRIVDLALASGVKVREDADLAQILAAVEVNTVIPLEAFMAVAEILAYVYRANRMDPPRPAAEGAAA